MRWGAALSCLSLRPGPLRALLPALLLLAACASPGTRTSPAPTAPAATPDAEPIEAPAFDAEAWTAAADTATTEASQIALAAQLLDAVDWRTACGEDDPTAPGRGTLTLAHLDDVWSLAAITCQRFATQSTFALVDARGGRPPRLVRALGVGGDGRPTADTTASFYGTLSHDRSLRPGRFDVQTKGAGHGGCGTDVRYRLRPDGGAEIERVRAHHDCAAPLAPGEWPVTYAAP